MHGPLGEFECGIEWEGGQVIDWKEEKQLDLQYYKNKK